RRSAAPTGRAPEASSLDQAAAETTMKRSRKNRPSPPDGPGQPLISVRCPSPECGKTYTIPASCAGKDARCTCGCVFPVPNGSAARRGAPPAPARVQPEGAAAGAAGEEVALRDGEHLSEVRVGCIGRGHAGKTALLRALGEGPVGDFFPSGLHV